MDLAVEIDTANLQQLLKAQADLLLLDCREPDEYETVHLAGATLIPMQMLPGRLSELGEDTARRIVVYCHHGARSLMVAHWLRQQGWNQAQSLSGGIDAWSVHIDPSKPRY